MSGLPPRFFEKARGLDRGRGLEDDGFGQAEVVVGELNALFRDTQADGADDLIRNDQRQEYMSSNVARAQQVVHRGNSGIPLCISDDDWFLRGDDLPRGRIIFERDDPSNCAWL